MAILLKMELSILGWVLLGGIRLLIGSNFADLIKIIDKWGSNSRRNIVYSYFRCMNWHKIQRKVLSVISIAGI